MRSNNSNLRRLINLPLGLVIDHIDRNPSNDDLTNLRIVNRTVNQLNNSKFNVYFQRSRGWFYSQVKFCGFKYTKCGFNTFEEAFAHSVVVQIDLLIEALKPTRHLNEHLTDEQYYRDEHPRP
jgi:hypothetical protein